MKLLSALQGTNRLFLLLLLANGFSNFVQFASSLLLARMLGPEQFGVFSFFATLAQSLSLFIDLGLCATMVRLASGKTHESGRKQMMFATAGVQIAVYAAMLAILIPGTHSVLTLFGQQGNNSLYYLACAMAGTIVLQWLIRSALEIYQNVLMLAGFTALYAVLRSAMFAFAYLSFDADISDYFLALYLLPLIITCALYLVFLAMSKPTQTAGTTMPETGQSFTASVSELFHYGKWMFSQPIYSMLYLIPIFTLSRYSSFELGIYSAAFTFSAIFPLINTSVRQITMPMVSRYTSRNELEHYMLQVKRKSLLAILCSAAIILAMAGLMMFVLDEQYESAFLVFCVLGSGMAATILLGQFNIISHVFRRPDLLMSMTLAQALFLLLACPLSVYWLDLGALGAAVAVALALLAGEVWLYYQLKKLRLDPTAAIHC